MNKKKHFLLEKIVNIMSTHNRGKLLDLGCGDGKTGKMLLDLGFSVSACDMDRDRFEFHDIIEFKECNLNNQLPYDDNTFDYVIFMEVIEHLYNPDFVVHEIRRVLKNGGHLILSTPNILNIRSRLRFLFEGSFDFFREPTLDYSKCFPSAIQNMHVIPWRYQELEYLLFKNKLVVECYYSDKKIKKFYPLYLLLMPVMLLQAKLKETRARRKGKVDFSRIHNILLSKELLLGRHLIIDAVKIT